MTIARVLAAVVAFAGAALATSGPASAQDPMSGVYTYDQPGRPAQTWMIYPTCLPAGCVLHMSMPDPAGGSAGGDARLVNDRWNFGWKSQVGFTCADGTKVPATLTYVWDDKTLSGTKKTLHGQVCGLEPAMVQEPFTLAYQRPLDMPVELYPLQCPTWPNCNYDSVIPGTMGR